ncbi:MAG TPA: hypothetical protein VK821_12235 [Dehalococcoidia bacterium]|nr:hypothetical protein [Dehalococcoidia bacterium]
MASPDDTLYVTMHAGTGTADTSPFIEVGWLQFGTAQAPYGQLPTVFVAGFGFQHNWYNYVLSSGQLFPFQLYSNGNNNTWTAYFWGNGQWWGLDTLTLSSSFTQEPNFVEEHYTNCDGSDQHFMTTGQIEAGNVQLEPGQGSSFFQWDPAYFPTQNMSQFTPFWDEDPAPPRYFTCDRVDWYYWDSGSSSC